MNKKHAKCAACGGDMVLGRGSKPPGEATHRRCRVVRHGTDAAYRGGCRCDECRAVKAAGVTEHRRRARATGRTYARKTKSSSSDWISRADRLAIYERDGWICRLCFGPVDPSLPPGDKWAASLDHKECRSWGEPDHSPANLRLAHRRCNSIRQDRPEVNLIVNGIPAEGSRLDALRALRRKLADQIDKTESGRDLAALAGRLQAVLQEIDDLEPAAPKGDELDEIAERRAARQRPAARAPRPKADAK